MRFWRNPLQPRSKEKKEKSTFKGTGRKEEEKGMGREGNDLVPFPDVKIL